jgi:ADP-ribose pyrophosphatase
VRAQVLNKQRVFDGFFQIDELTLRYQKFDGAMTQPVKRLVFERGDSVAAVILNTDTGRLIFCNQFKAPTHEKGPGWITELMAGMIDPGESAEDALRREVLEETGYRPTVTQHLATFYVSPGGSSERIFLYYAEVNNASHSGRGGGLPEEGEDIKLIEMTVPEALAAMSSRQFIDAKTIIGLMWLKDARGSHE